MALKADTGAAEPGLLLLFLKLGSTLTFRHPRLQERGWRTLPGLGDIGRAGGHWQGWGTLAGLGDISGAAFASTGRNFPVSSKIHRVPGYSRLEGIHRDH